MSHFLHNAIAWDGLELRLPRDWEISRHSLPGKSGGLTVVDRRRQRLELTWRHCDREPDVRRSCNDLRERLGGRGGSSETRRLDSVPGWLGFWHREDQRRTVAHALSWQKTGGRLLQIAIIALEDDRIAKRRLAEEILRNCRDTGGNDRPKRWKAFGVDCITPPGWRLVETSIKPMNVMLRFEHFPAAGNNPDGREAEIYRVGMADTWFNGDARAYLQGRQPSLDFKFGHDICCGHPAVTAQAENESRRLWRWFGRRRLRRELIWHCEQSNAIFRVGIICQPNDKLTPRDFKLCCCQPAATEAR